jgi:hypothetical protein
MGISVPGTFCDLWRTKRLFDDHVPSCTRVSLNKKLERDRCTPLGPRVTLTALARTSTPFKILARPSLENLISLWAPRVNEGLAFAAARRRAFEEVFENGCIVVVNGVDELSFERKKKLGILWNFLITCHRCDS